jgi:hypothetical protein
MGLCSKCKKEEKTSGAYCRKCASEYMKHWYRERTNDLSERVKIRKTRMVSSARKRAIKFGVDCDISVDSFEIPDCCPALGIKLSLENKHIGLDSPTLDRLKPELGYVEGNVNVISQKANLIKSNGSPEDLKMVLDWVLAMS